MLAFIALFALFAVASWAYCWVLTRDNGVSGEEVEQGEADWVVYVKVVALAYTLIFLVLVLIWHSR